MKQSFYRAITFTTLFIAVGFLGNAKAQSALDGFDPNANGLIRVVVLQPDGKILIGGAFTTLAPNGGASVTRNRIARLNPDGTLDTAFNPNANDQVYSMAVQADGKIVASGLFTNMSGLTRNRIARLDSTTGLADSFDPNANNLVMRVSLQPDGVILAGGSFTNIGGQVRNRIARLDPATGLADSFDPNADNAIQAILTQSDGKLLVAGFFTNIGGQVRNRIARLDPITGLADAFNPNANATVQNIAVQADGKLLVGGNFTTIGGQARNAIARLDPTTGLADAFNPNTNTGGIVQGIIVQPDGKILVAGNYSSIGGQTRNHIARLNATTGLADAFNPNANLNASSIALQEDGKILVSGNFTTLSPNGGSALTRNRIARLEVDGSADSTFGNLGLDGDVYAIAIQPDGKILIGGSFTTVLGQLRRRLARLNTDGTLDAAFPNVTGDVYSIVVQADGKILVGGDFTAIFGLPRNRIARLSSNTGVPDSWDPDANGIVRSINVQTDGKILVGGEFTTIGGANRSRIARLNPVTGLADSFSANLNSSVTALAVQSDGKVLAGGYFTDISGQTRNRIARLDAVTGATDSFNPNANNTVRTIVVQPDNKILVGGDFSNISGQSRQGLARLDPTTGLADSFNPNGSILYINSLVTQADGKILVGGSFSTIGGQTRNGLARLDPTTGLADSFNAGLNFWVWGIALQADGKILVGGTFDTIAGETRNGFARLINDTVATQDLSVAQTFAAWTRGGSSVRFSRVTFEDSTDGVNYNFLGNGVASGNDWVLTGLNLSQQNLFIRARGYYYDGQLNASESIQEYVRNVVPAPAISGTVTYGNAIGNPAPPRFVKNVSVTSMVGSPAVGPVITGTPGTYALTGFGAGSYTIKPTKPGGSNGAITSNDAARVAQGVVSSPAFVSQNQRFAADTSGNGNVTSNDAALIARFAAGLTGAGNAGQWKFFVTGAPSPLPTPPQTYNDSRTYASVTSSLTGEDYVAILVGEVSGNWNPATHPRPAGIVENGKRKVDSEDGGQERGIEVKLPQMTVSTDKEIVIPISVQGVANKEIISYEFDLRYDPSVIQPLENPVDVAGTVSRGLMVVANPYESGLLRVVVYGAIPIDENGVLLNLRFTAVGAGGSISQLMFERIMFNEGDPISLVTDGKIELLSASSN